jgi:hypothetical protein
MSMTPLGIEPMTFRLVVQCPDKLHCVPPLVVFGGGGGGGGGERREATFLCL